MPDYRISTDKTWSQTLDDLDATMRKWGVSAWRTSPQRPPRKRWYRADERRVDLTFERGGRSITISHDRQATPEDNLRVLYLAAEAMRLNERRGIAAVLASAYAQLPPPEDAAPVSPDDPHADPYTVLGLQPGAPLAVAEAAYRALAKAMHPDAGGDPAQFARLTAAIEAIRKEKA
jgi:DnaJ-domain-containing protein 1